MPLDKPIADGPMMLLQGVLTALAPAGARGRLSILIYHRVLEAPDPLFPDILDAAGFALQLGWIKRLFQVLPLDEAIQRLERGTLPARSACITFDDGYADNLNVALPLLRQYGMNATFFIATAYLDGGRMWNDTIIESVRAANGNTFDLRSFGLARYPIGTPSERRATIDAVVDALKYLPCTERERRAADIRGVSGVQLPDDLMLTTDQVRALRDAGMGIGAHTATHPILAGLDPDASRREIIEGRESLQHILGERVTLFAYPNGRPGRDYLPEHVGMVKALGFSAAVTTGWGTAARDTELFQLPRFTPWQRTPGRFGLGMVRNLLRGR